MSKDTWKSIGACALGFFSVAIFSVATDALLENTNIFPAYHALHIAGTTAPWMLVVALIHRCIYTIFGGYIIAKLAPSKPMKHVIIVAIIGTILATLGTISNWNLGNHWYPILLVVTAFPCMWLGAKLAIRTK